MSIYLFNNQYHDISSNLKENKHWHVLTWVWHKTKDQCYLRLMVQSLAYHTLNEIEIKTSYFYKAHSSERKTN